MRFAEDNKDFLVREYVENNRSTYWISEKLGTYPNKVRRALKFLGVDLKSKSENCTGQEAVGRNDREREVRTAEHGSRGRSQSQSGRLQN